MQVPLRLELTSRDLKMAPLVPSMLYSRTVLEDLADAFLL